MIKPGDNVICIDDFNQPNFSTSGVVKNGIYKIYQILDNEVELTNVYGFRLKRRFKPLGPVFEYIFSKNIK